MFTIDFGFDCPTTKLNTVSLTHTHLLSLGFSRGGVSSDR